MAKIKRVGKNILNIFKGAETIPAEFITINEKETLRRQIATEYHIFF